MHLRARTAWLGCSQIAAQERFLDKRNYAYWVGRVQFTEEGERDRQRHVLVECGKRLREIGDPRAGYISINGGGNYPITVGSLSQKGQRLTAKAPCSHSPTASHHRAGAQPLSHWRLATFIQSC